MNQTLLISLAVQFVVRQVAKFGKDADRAKIKADIKPRIEQLIPGSNLDATAVAIVNTIIDAVFEFISSADVLTRIVTDLIEGKFEKVVEELMAYLQAHMPKLALA